MLRLLARNDGRKMSRNDGKIVVVARSAAIAKRRGNLAKSLSGGGERLPRLLARNDGKPAGSQGHGGERLLRLLARNDGRCGNDSDRIKPSICFFNFEFVNFRFDLPAGKTGI